MEIKPWVFSPVPMMPKVPAYMINSRPAPLNGELYDGSGSGIAALGEVIGAEGVMKDGSFDTVMLRALDTVNGDLMNAENLHQQMILDPDSVDVHDVTNAQARASLSLNIARTILNRVVQSWKDIINTR